MEAAVQLKENHGAETTLVSIGGGDNTDMIRRCYAMGIDNGIHIEDPALAKADSSIFARVLQKVFEKGGYDLVITGKQAQDTDNGQTGIMLAEYPGLPCVSNVIDIEVLDERHIKVCRLGDAGTEIVELELPAVVTVSDSINEPRLPAMRGIMMAKKKAIDLDGFGRLGDLASMTSAETRPNRRSLNSSNRKREKPGKNLKAMPLKSSPKSSTCWPTRPRCCKTPILLDAFAASRWRLTGFLQGKHIMAKVLVVAEIKQGIKGSTAELLSKARAIGAETAVVAIGANIEALIPTW